MEIGSAVSPFTVGVVVSTAPTTATRQQNEAVASAETGSHVYQRSMGTTGADTSALLANNLAHTPGGQSKYVAATLTNLQTDRQFGNKMGSLLSSLDAQYAQLAASGTSVYAAATLMQHRVEEGVQQVTNHEYLSASGDNLDDLKSDIEQRAEAATQPEDASQTDMAGTSEAPNTAETTPRATTSDETRDSEQATTPPTATAVSVDRLV